jgi:pilus assembly protein FimV
MPRRFIRLLLVFVMMLSSEVWALGLGEVRLDSALNQPMRAEIELLGATPEELANLTVTLASAETFERYGIDRPFYLQDLVFDIVQSGREDGNYVRVRSASPMTEPFLTFLVSATWSRGQLLREYTVLLDPPTFAPSSTTQAQPTIAAPQPSTTTDSGRIDREPAPRTTAPAPQPTPPAQTRPAPQQSAPVRPAPKPLPVADDTPYDTAGAADYVVQRGETLWGIASSMRPDSRLSMNQTMLAIFEANPQAFESNINIMKAGASLNLPSADDIYQIDRSDASSEVQRHHSSWGSYVPPAVTSEPIVDTEDSRPSLTLVPPDEDPVGIDTGSTDTAYGDEPLTREQEIEDRMAELEAADVPIQQSLIEIRDNELAALRQELANIRGEVYEPEPLVDDTTALEDSELDAETIAEDALDDAVDEEPEPEIAQSGGNILRDAPSSPSFIDQAIGWITSTVGMIIAGVVALVAGLLFWFMRRDRDDDDDSGVWNALDADEVRIDPLDSTESLQAPRHDDSIVVVEQEAPVSLLDDDTIESPLAAASSPEAGPIDETSQFGSLEDTFSSETAVNLDQSDPTAEADFHMAYGLYDQAADLINGALQVEPERQDLLTKLCEIYFVWGNRDSFVDAAQRLNSVVGGGESADWDKIVIMGQQIAADHDLFAGAGVAGATKAVDLSFDDESGGTGALDMEFGADDGSDDIIDLGADAGQADDDAVDFLFDDVSTEVLDSSDTSGGTADFSVTAEMPTIETSMDETTVETPTIEEQFAGFDSTSELPSIDESALDSAIEDSGEPSDATAEIDLADLDLDLDIDGLAETELASLDDLDVTGTNETLSASGMYGQLDAASDVTGKNPQIDPDSTGVQTRLDPEQAGLSDMINMEDELSTSGEMRLAPDETGQNPMIDAVGDNSGLLEVDESLLDATGHTQIISEDMAVETATEESGGLSDNDATLLASGYGDDDTIEAPPEEEETVLASLDDDGDEGDFDFAKTEALPPEVFTGSTSLDETGELPAVASTDVDLDLDDLTAALKVSELGDTVEQPRDDKTVEQPRPVINQSEGEDTMALGPGDMSDDLHDARTMTEVGTKLDLARAYVDMGDPAGARSILEEVLDEGDEAQRQQAQQLLDSLPS